MATLETDQFNPDIAMTSPGPVCISNLCSPYFEKPEKNYGHMINYGLLMMWGTRGLSRSQIGLFSLK